MRNIQDVLKEKQRQLEVVKREVEALRLAASLMKEDGDSTRKNPEGVEIPWKDATTGRPVRSWP